MQGNGFLPFPSRNRQGQTDEPMVGHISARDLTGGGCGAGVQSMRISAGESCCAETTAMMVCDYSLEYVDIGVLADEAAVEA